MSIYHWLAIAFAWLGLVCIIGIQYRNMKRLDEERERWRQLVERLEQERKDLPPSGGNSRADRG